MRDDLWLFADVAGVLSGNNSIDTDTNTLEDQILWSAGGRWQPSERISVEAFATDAAGPSLTSSLLAAPDGGEEPGSTEGSLDVFVQRDQSGGPQAVSGSEVSVYYASGMIVGLTDATPVATGTTGQDGHVVFNDLNPAAYRVVAQDSGQEVDGLAQVISGQTTHITLTLPAVETSGNLHVCARDGSNNPVSAHVVVTPQTSGSQVGAHRVATALVQAYWQGDTGEDGCILFEDLPPGDYEVTATAPGYSSPVSDTTHVTAGETANVILYFTYEYY